MIQGRVAEAILPEHVQVLEALLQLVNAKDNAGRNGG